MRTSRRNKRIKGGNRLKKIMTWIILWVILGISLMPMAYAQTEVTDAYIEYSHDTGHHLKYWKSSINDWSYVNTAYVQYEHNGVKYPAYCANRDKIGVEVDSNYQVNVLDHLKDDRIWRVVTNGYPYQTPQQMGVENEDDAFVATKHAIYSILYDISVADYYKGGDERGKKIVQAIEHLVDIGRNEKAVYQQGDIQLKEGGLQEDKDYYIKSFWINSQMNLQEYEVTQMTGATQNSILLGENNQPKNVFRAGEEGKIVIPKKEFKKDMEIHLKVRAKCQNYPIFYGYAEDETRQNYILSFDQYEWFQEQFKMNIPVCQSQIKVIKKDKENQKPLAGIRFEIYYQDGEKIGTYQTNSKGEIVIGHLRPGIVMVKEIETKQNYILDEKIKEIEVGYQTNQKLEIWNQRKKGSLKIIKQDKDDPKLRIPSVEFELINEKGEVVQKIKTNEKGEAEVGGLDIGKYVLKETKNNQAYRIGTDQTVTIEWNKLSQMVIENEKKKGKIEIVKVDADQHEIKMPDVEFDILDAQGKIVEHVITNADGVAISSDLPIGMYQVKETRTSAVYELKEEPETVEVKDHQTTSICIENHKIKMPKKKVVQELPKTGM